MEQFLQRWVRAGEAVAGMEEEFPQWRQRLAFVCAQSVGSLARAIASMEKAGGTVAVAVTGGGCSEGGVAAVGGPAVPPAFVFLLQFARACRERAWRGGCSEGGGAGEQDPDCECDEAEAEAEAEPESESEAGDSCGGFVPAHKGMGLEAAAAAEAEVQAEGPQPRAQTPAMPEDSEDNDPELEALGQDAEMASSVEEAAQEQAETPEMPAESDDDADLNGGNAGPPPALPAAAVVAAAAATGLRTRAHPLQCAGGVGIKRQKQGHADGVTAERSTAELPQHACWACQSCTFINEKAQAPVCELCSAPRPAAAAVTATALSSLS
jgi:hypothetical protein